MYLPSQSKKGSSMDLSVNASRFGQLQIGFYTPQIKKKIKNENKL